MSARFKFHEIVIVRTDDQAKASINGKKGRISGIAEPESNSDVWSYSVFIYDKFECWCCDEAELQKTGRLDTSEDTRDVGNIRVRVDEKGRGILVNNDRDESGET